MHPPCPDKRRRSIDRGLLLSTISLALLSSPTPLYGQSPTYSQAPATAERSLNDLPGDMLPGVAQPLQFAELAPPVDGVVASIGIEEGQLVTANQLLLTIDNRIAKASYAVAKVTAEKTASLEAARAKVVLAEQYLQRIEQAYQKQAASGLELDEAKSRLREAKAALAEGLEVQHEAEVRLDLERQRLEAHELHAPFAGVVTRINKQPGEAATRDQHLITLANLSRLRVELFIPLTELAHLHVGDAIALQADAPVNRVLKATITSIDPVLDAATGTVRVVAEIDNTGHKMPAGFAVRLTLASPAEDATDGATSDVTAIQ